MALGGLDGGADVQRTDGEVLPQAALAVSLRGADGRAGATRHRREHVPALLGEDQGSQPDGHCYHSGVGR